MYLSEWKFYLYCKQRKVSNHVWPWFVKHDCKPCGVIHGCNQINKMPRLSYTRGRSFCAENTGENDIIWMVMIMARTARKKWTASHRGSSIRLPAINYASSLAQRSWKTLQRSSQRSPGNTSRSWRMRACQSVKSAAWQESSSGSYANCKHKRTVPLCYSVHA